MYEVGISKPKIRRLIINEKEFIENSEIKDDIDVEMFIKSKLSEHGFNLFNKINSEYDHITGNVIYFQKYLLTPKKKVKNLRK